VRNKIDSMTPAGRRVVCGYSEGHFTSQLWAHERTGVLGLQLRGDLADPAWGSGDQSDTVNRLNKTLDELEKRKPAMLVIDLSALTEVGPWGLYALEDTVRLLKRNGTSMRMVLNPELVPTIVHDHMLTWMELANDVGEAIWDLYLERHRAA